MNHGNSAYTRGCRCDECKKGYREYRKARYHRIMEALIEEWGGKCSHCESTSALEFHHVDPSTKVQRVTWLVQHKGLDTVIEECRKCILLCDLCHDKHHSNGGLTDDGEWKHEV